MVLSDDEVTPEQFAAMVQSAYDGLPEIFRQLTDDIVLHTPDEADPDVLQHLGIEGPLHLLGLYQGVDVTQKSLLDTNAEPDRVFLYRLPILRAARDGMDQLDRLISHVLVHEIGHHFGYSDEDMHRIEEDADGQP